MEQNENKKIYDNLDFLATRGMIDALYDAEIISAEAHEQAFDKLFPSHDWGKWIVALTRALGIALVLAGIVFFFAFNWAVLGRLFKLFLVEFLFVCMIAVAGIKGIDNIYGKFAGLCASVIVGVFLAVFGQMYQTGADSYLLFAGWSLMILPLVVLVKFAPIWSIWLIVTDLGIIFYWGQVLSGFDSLEINGMFFALACFNGAVLVLREIITARGGSWLDSPWLTNLFTVFIILPINLLVLKTIFVDGIGNPAGAGSHTFIALVSLICVKAVLLYYFRHSRREVTAIGIIILSACIMISTIISRYLIKIGEIGFFFIMAIVVFVIFAAGVIVLINVARSINSERNAKPPL